MQATEYKSCAPNIKRVSPGQATVVIATLGVKDKDGDVLMPGFFQNQTVSVKPTHNWHHYDIGKARIYEVGNEALADVTFYLKTDEGRNWHASILADYENPPPVQQYSFGFKPLPGGTAMGEHAGEQVRFLKPLDDGQPGAEFVEMSPVTRGAGQNTRTLDIKSLSDDLKQEGFSIQSLIFPKSKWEDAAAVRAWCSSHDFTASLDETETSWRARQRDPGDFTRLRTICINPSQDASAEDCRVQAVGGPVRESAERHEVSDVKQLTLEQLLLLTESKIDHLAFVQKMRQRSGKTLGSEVVALIDQVSVKFTELRALVKLRDLAPNPEDVAMSKRYDEIKRELSAQAERERQAERAEDAALLARYEARKAKVATMRAPR